MKHLKASHLTVLRSRQIILRRVDFSLSAGEIVYLRGDNGSGKTTLLQTLAGLIQPKAGSIARHQPLIYLGHKPGVKPLLTVSENVSLFATLYHHLNQNNKDTTIHEALNKVGLATLADRQTRYLSAGQQRRCQLARLWLPSPNIWLLDEPFTALDVHVSKRLTERCQMHLQQGGSIVVTSHQSFNLDDYPIRHVDLTAHA